MNMFNPPHPGETIKDLILDPLGMSTSEAGQGAFASGANAPYIAHSIFHYSW
ncbi:MAG: hypothetical protein GY862_18395 [Gammaproteobacteria bacterium]|nr:hypothetical protein [Gammaproteobacteria bacterium]